MVVKRPFAQAAAIRADLALPGGLQYREGGLLVLPEIDCALDGPGALRRTVGRAVILQIFLLAERPLGPRLHVWGAKAGAVCVSAGGRWLLTGI